MLNGIEVLNESCLINESEFANGSLCIFLLIGVIMVFGIGLDFALCSDSTILKTIGIIVMICSFVGFVLSIIYSSSPSNIKQYQVTISDDVSMVEFNERYDVIDVEGKIWTIIEKE